MPKSKTSPTARTLKQLRERGWTCGVVERFNSFILRRQDLFGCIDVIAVHDDKGTLGVQATSDQSGGNMQARIEKAMAQEDLRAWLRAGNRFQVFAWRKLKLFRGSKAVRWEAKIRELTLTADAQWRVLER